MEKIITKSVKDKVTEWLDKYNVIKVHEIEYEDYVTKEYASNGGDSGNDFDILVVSYKNDEVESAVLHTFKGMDIDKYLSNEPYTYDFYAWIEMNCEHINSESYNDWVKGNSYNDYYFSLYFEYLLSCKKQECITNQFEPDCKEITLAEKIKNSFAEVFDKDEWDKVLSDAFHTENAGQGVWLVRSDSSFYEKGYSCTLRTANCAYIIMVNSNIWGKVTEYVKGEGFGLWDGTATIYGSSCVQGKRVTLY